MISRATTCNRLRAWQNELRTNAHGMAQFAERAIAELSPLCQPRRYERKRPESFTSNSAIQGCFVQNRAR
jgi:hypothetical protein